VHLERLGLRDFRNYEDVEVTLAPGLTALIGRNGQGKTNLLEALAYLATLRSFRTGGSDALVRHGATSAYLRAEGVRGDGRRVELEAEISTTGRNRALLNRQRLQRARDLLGVIRATVFTPEDLGIVKEGPQLRRDLLDDVLVALDPRHEGLRSQLERVLRQRNALLRQVGGRLDAESELTLGVWDEKLAPLADTMVGARAWVVSELEPRVASAYAALAAEQPWAGVGYRPSVGAGALLDVLHTNRREDVQRGVTTAGPHRDDLDLTLRDLPVRTHGSQGEQRTFALALKLAAHQLVTERVGEAPLLLLDDVFSELDPRRGAALLANLPPGQTVLTSADRLPEGTRPELTYTIDAGRVT
jgi:DNA replication and repair protein RecF